MPYQLNRKALTCGAIAASLYVPTICFGSGMGAHFDPALMAVSCGASQDSTSG